MINIGFDGYGGDNGLIEIIKAIYSSIDENVTYTIYGNELNIQNVIKKCGYDLSKLRIVNCEEQILMDEHPVLALRSKKNSSLRIASNELKENKIDAFISAGNTGALLSLGIFFVGILDKIKRPAVGAIIPTKLSKTLIIDSGANMDSEPLWLYNYAIMGHCYMKKMYDITKPKVALLSVGTEDTKGNSLTLKTFELLKQNKNINFIGNVEARDVSYGVCDVLVCDGFAGNVLLKMYEGSAKVLLNTFKEVFYKNIFTKIGALLLKKELNNTLKKFDAKNYGGAPLLGCKNLIVKCHGNATKYEYKCAINQCINFVKNDINYQINNMIKETL